MNIDPRPRRERADNAAKRRRQIIEATIDSVALHGLSGTTLATVAEAAGLSQGVAVFYFKTKDALLAETLRWQYQEYRAVWQAALAAAGPDPATRVRALVDADFDAAVCNRRMLALWYACWGEAKARPLIAQLSADFDGERDRAMRDACAACAAPGWTADLLAQALDGISDGLWLKLHLAPGEIDLAAARGVAHAMLAAVFPAPRAG